MGNEQPQAGGVRAEAEGGGRGTAAAALADLASIAEEVARLEAASDPAAARATGVLPAQEVPALPQLAPEALTDKARAQRELARRVRQVSWREQEAAASEHAGGADPLDAQARARVLRDHLLDRLETSSQMIELGEEGAHLGNLTSPFQRLRRELVRALEHEAQSPQAQDRAARVLESLPQALEALGEGLTASARAGVVAPRRQVLLVVGQVEALLGSGGPLRVAAGAEAPSAQRRRRLDQAVTRVRQAGDGLVSLMREQIAPVAPTREGVGPQRHRLWTRRLLGTQLVPEEICDWAREELRAVVARQDALAREVLGAGAGSRPGEAAAAYDSYLRAAPE